MLPARSSPRTVLVVDDTPRVLDQARRALEAAGFTVATALQGHDAVAVARRIRPSVVVLEVQLPEVSGWDVIRSMHALPELAETPVVLCSDALGEAIARLADARGASGAGRVGLLPKPYDDEELVEVVRAILADQSPATLPPRGRAQRTGPRDSSRHGFGANAPSADPRSDGASAWVA
ncbi:MAG: response regulator [Chloroflexi bacterium]|nr:response regulator [Chloroflexota bacterium]